MRKEYILIEFNIHCRKRNFTLTNSTIFFFSLKSCSLNLSLFRCFFHSFSFSLANILIHLTFYHIPFTIFRNNSLHMQNEFVIAILLNKFISHLFVNIFDCLHLYWLLIHISESWIKLLNSILLLVINILEMNPSEFCIRIQHLFIVIYRILAHPFENFDRLLSRFQLEETEASDRRKNFVCTNDMYLLISTKLPQSPNCLHKLVLSHVRPQRKGCNSVHLHLHVSSSGSRFIKNHEGLRLGNARFSCDNGMSDIIVYSPHSVITAVRYPFVV